MPSPNNAPTRRLTSFTRARANAMLRRSLIAKEREEVLVVPAKAKKRTKKKAVPKKK